MQTPKNRHEVRATEIQGDRGAQTLWAGDPSPQDFSKSISLAWQATFLGTTDTENGGPCTREGLAASS